MRLLSVHLPLQYASTALSLEFKTVFHRKKGERLCQRSSSPPSSSVKQTNLGAHLQQELLELKQLYVKATGEAFGAGAKGKADSDKKKKKGGGGDGQPKQMDTRKADKAKKVNMSVALRPKSTC